MKRSLFSQKLVDLFSKLDINHSYVLDGFHLDFFLSLYRALGVPSFIVFPDNLFDSILKYLSILQEDPLVVFVPPANEKSREPDGFIPYNSFQLRRSRELLSSGLGEISFVVCAESGLSVPLVGDASSDELNFSFPVDFDACISFLSSHDYRSVDVVFGPGEFCVRGGIVDVYPFSSTGPVRLSFLDDVIDVHRFDVLSQLTSGRINNFSISATHKRALFPLKDCSLSGFLSLFYCPDKTIDLNIAPPVGFSKVFTSMTFEEFIQRGGAGSNNVDVDGDLSSTGVIDPFNNFIVPPWFVNVPPVFSTSKSVNYIPLDVATIKKGDYLVHRDHGVGIFMGLLVPDDKNAPTQEFLSIKYEDGGIIRLDACRLDLVDYYAAADTEGVCLDSLQKKTVWSRKRRAAQRHAEEAISYLLNMYVRRSDVSRAPFVPCVEMELQFLNDFPHKDTDDQISVWKEISADLSSSAPMDRLLCGDVGFGKTEIALRASFRVVLGGRRVLVLAPTTILANQLYASFHARLGAHAVSVEMVSRFRSVKNINVIRENIISGKNDILVGTHSILNNDIYLKNLGLLVVDEEHRFGVRQKEKIKCFKENIDVLSMSATPIPRSLNLAISGIYSISLLQTPPLMRLPIITHVNYFSYSLILEAISFETGRGGQVYFVHNNTRSIKQITARLEGLLPLLKIIFIHGQESAHEIERKMDLFVSKNVHVLVCTSIIEAGIDVPNANCIIINNSHLFGLSQLYQIRGRVGRGHRQAHAYLMIPVKLKLSNSAFNRIKTIEENTLLGSGYNISRADMSLRGSGSLFGYKQSGGSGSVGYEMYLRLIRNSLHGSGKLKSDFVVLPEDVLIEVFIQRLIPENYMSHESLRLSFYKSLSSAQGEEEINKIQYHLINRFGPLPRPVKNLIQECRLRLWAARVGVLSLRAHGCGVVCKIMQNDSAEYIASVLEYLDGFFAAQGVDFHILPKSGAVMLVCIHIPHKTDKYTLLSLFLDKFKALT